MRTMAFILAATFLLTLSSSTLVSAADGPKPCATCKNTGRGPCAACKGTGVSRDKTLTCKTCKGEGKAKCKKCDEKHKVKCPKCKRKEKKEGKYVVISNVWKEWKADNYFKERKAAEPDKFIICPTCKGTGNAACPTCKGTGEAKCRKCNGSGKRRGKAPCAICHGTKRGPCAACATLKPSAGEAEATKLAALDNLLEKKIIDDATYWKQRRTLVAKLNAALPDPTEADKAAVKASKAAAEAKAKEFKIDPEKLAKRVEDLEALLQALGSGVIPAPMYEKRTELMGLPTEALDRAEAAAADTSDDVAAYVRLKKRFRRGGLDRAGYEAALKDL